MQSLHLGKETKKQEFLILQNSNTFAKHALDEALESRGSLRQRFSSPRKLPERKLVQARTVREKRGGESSDIRKVWEFLHQQDFGKRSLLRDACREKTSGLDEKLGKGSNVKNKRRRSPFLSREV